MLDLPRSPHGDHGIEEFLRTEPISVFSQQICVALEHDQRGCAGRMCCCEQRPRRERAVDRDEDRFATPEIV